MKKIDLQLNRYPFKYAVLFSLALKNDEMSIDEVMEELADDYGSEKQFTDKSIRYHLDSFVCVGMAEVTKETITEEGNLDLKYKITDFGMERTRFLPDEWLTFLPN